MIKNHKPGDVFYHEPTKQWVRVINKTTPCWKTIPCWACAFGAGEDCLAYDCEAVKCLEYGYVKARRPKNTIHASELAGARDDNTDRIGYAAYKLSRAYADDFEQHTDKATIGDAAGLKSAKKDTAAFIDSVTHKMASAFAKSVEATSPLKPTKEFAGLDTKETIFTQARRYGKNRQTLESLFVRQPQKEHKPIEPTKCWIVCLFFGGKLLPSAMPKQHKSFESAARESQRLAELHNKTFIVLSALSVTKKITMPVVVSL